MNKYTDLLLINPYVVDSFEFVIYNYYNDDYNIDTNNNNNMITTVSKRYKKKFLKANDEMKEFRQKFKSTFSLSYIGHLFTLYARPATYNMLKEWLVYDVNEIAQIANTKSLYFDPPHVIVFDMDSTLITEEENVQIRDSTIYKALDELKSSFNCVLCLWSYGDREHVVHSLNKVGLNKYFDIILSEGRRAGVYEHDKEIDYRYNVMYKSTPFYLDYDIVTTTTGSTKKHIPKSPRVILWYLQKHDIVFFKTITLVDDLYDNNINYDNFVNLNTCPLPINDWHHWHKQIVRFIINYDTNTNINGRNHCVLNN